MKNLLKGVYIFVLFFQIAHAQYWPSGIYSGIKFQGDSVIRVTTPIITCQSLSVFNTFNQTAFQVFKNDSLIIDSLFDVTNMPKWGNYIDYWNYSNASQGALILPLQNNKLLFCSLLPLSLDPSDEYAKLYLCLYDTMSHTLLHKQKYMFRGLSEKMMAVRHANGRDWWLINKDMASFEYIKTLIINEQNYSFHTFRQKIGYENSIGDGRDGMIKFSKNGKRLCTVYYVAWTAIDLLDFNRNLGVLQNPRKFNGNGNEYLACELDSTGKIAFLSTYSDELDCGVLFFCNITSDSLLIYDTLKVAKGRAINSPQLIKNTTLLFNDRIYNAYPSGGLPSLDSIFHQEDSYFSILDSLNGTPRRYNTTGCIELPNLPNYELGPDLNPGFNTNLPDTVLCVGQTFTVTDTSWGHFRRMWEWGDGSFSDTLPVKQHWELLGLLDTFRVMSHTFTQPGTYNLTLHIINDSSEFGYMDSTVTKTFVVLPWCQAPVIQAHTDTVCLGAPLTLAAAGDSATYTWTFTNGTTSGTQISHIFSQSGWNVFSLNVNKFGIDTTLIDSVFVKDCISADFQTEMIPFCDSVLVKVYPQVSKGQIDKITASFQNQSISCLDSCHFTVLENIEENLMLSFENSTVDTSIVKNLKINLLDCPEFIEIYPNPVTDQLQIHFRLEKPENLRLCNALGQDVLHLELQGNGIYSVDVNALARGFYHLRLERHPDKKRGLKERWKLVLE